MPLRSHHQQKTNKNCQNFLGNDLKDRCIGRNVKQKVRIKTQQMSINISSNQTMDELTECLF